MNKHKKYLVLLSLLTAFCCILPSSFSTFIVTPSDKEININVSHSEEIPPLEINIDYNQTYNSNNDSLYDEYKVFSLGAGEHLSINFNVTSNGYSWTNGNKSYVSKIETSFLSITGEQISDLSGNCRVLYADNVRNYYRNNISFNSYAIENGYGGTNLVLPKEGVEMSLDIENTSNEEINFVIEISSLPSENYSFAYVVGDMSNPTWNVGDSYFIMSPALYVNENIGIYDDDNWYWEWIASNANSAIGYNINFKAMKDGKYSAGNNYYTHGFRVDEVSWTGSGNDVILCHHI